MLKSSIGDEWIGTCSIINPKAWCVTFVRNREYLKRLDGCNLNLGIFVPRGMDGLHIGENVRIWEVDYPEYDFVVFHNEINHYRSRVEDVFGSRCDLHSTMVVGSGIRVANGPGGVKVQLKHMGNVIFGDDVYVGPLTLIERGCLDSTIIGNGAKIDGRCTIGHNSVIGKNTVIATGAVIGGSVIIGENCWIGLNATVRNGVKICDDVIVGMASAVVKDITEPGIYVGIPAIFKKPYTEGWNF